MASSPLTTSSLTPTRYTASSSTRNRKRRTSALTAKWENVDDDADAAAADDDDDDDDDDGKAQRMKGLLVTGFTTFVLCARAPASASVYYSTAAPTNPFELRMEKKTGYVREETPKSAKMNTLLPLRLSADKDEDLLDERYDTGVPSSSRMRDYKTTSLPPRKQDVFRTLSAAFQWLVIFYVAYAARDGRTKGLRVTKKLGLDGKARKELIDKTFLITLDFGREVGTWMPAKWAGSGKRVILPIRVKFLEENKVNIESVGAFCPVKILPGKWSVDGDTLRFSIILGATNERLEKGDVFFDSEEEITCKCMAWGGQVSRRGKLLVKKTRFGIRKEWRSVGIFSAEENSENTVLGTMRVRERFTSMEMFDSSSSSL